MKGRWYIAGPMSGLKDMNFPAFHEAAAQLRACGFEVISPAEVNPEPDMKWEEAMKRDIPHLLTCDGVALLPDWKRSRGARIELELALALGLSVNTVRGLVEGR